MARDKSTIALPTQAVSSAVFDATSFEERWAAWQAQGAALILLFMAVVALLGR